MIYVREMEHRDVDAVADYWLLSTPEHLMGMGVDLNKLPERLAIKAMIEGELKKTVADRMSYALIWEYNKEAIGHCNVNQIKFGVSAFMHLHLWKSDFRQKGLGTALVKQSLPYFFDKLKLQRLYSEPYALNPAPNKTLAKVGFSWEKKHTTIPGTLNFEQEVNRWVLNKSSYCKLLPSK